MKKILSMVFIFGMVFILGACGSKEDSGDISRKNDNAKTEKSIDNTESPTEKPITDTEINADSLDSLKEKADKDVEDAIANLTEVYEKLKTKISTYSKYKTNVKEVEALYGKILSSQKELTINLREYALNYAKAILASGSNPEDMCDEMEDLYNDIYDEIGEDVYDKIYDGILEDIYGDFYDGILEDAYDTAKYAEWSKLRSKEYKWWSKTRSACYRDWTSFRSDVYDFWSDVNKYLYRDDMEKVNKIIKDFEADIKR